MENILNQIRQFIEQRESQKTWTPGKDMVGYSGTYFSSDEYVSAVESLLGGWLGMANKCNRFELKFPKEFGRKHGILTNSGSSANLLMMASLSSKRSYNFPKGTKVLTPIAGFPTTVNPIFQLGYEPVFLDIELETLNLDLTQAEDLIKKHDIKIITFAHTLGNPPNMDQVMSLVKQYNLVLLEDCCDALGSTYQGKPLGSFGQMASCSFYPAHHMTMGEGGFVVCENSEQEKILRSFRDWGRSCYCNGPGANTLKNGTCGNRFSCWVSSMPNEIFDHKYIYDEIGYNLKPIEIQGAMGLEQIKKLPEIHMLRKRNYQLLMEIYSDYEEFFYLPRPQKDSDPSWFAFPLTVKRNAPFTKNKFVLYLEENLIQTRPYFAGNIMLQPAYSHAINSEECKKNFPNATFAMTHTFFHGTSPVITATQMNYIGDCVRKFFKSSL